MTDQEMETPKRIRRKVLSDYRFKGRQIQGVLYQSVFESCKKIITALIEKEKEPTSNKDTGMNYDDIMKATGIQKLPLANAILILTDTEILKIEGGFSKSHSYYWLVTLNCENPIKKFKSRLNERR